METKPRKYRKKPVVIEAMYLGPSPEERITVSRWLEGNNVPRIPEDDLSSQTGHYFLNTGTGMCIRTMEGDMEARVGNMVILGVKGEAYACDLDIFRMTYDEVE